MDIPQTTHLFRAAFRYCFKNSEFKSQKAVAMVAGVSESTISEMMTKKSYSPQTQAKIAKVFGYYDLLDFFALGRKLLEGNHKPDSFIIQVGKSGPGGADRTLQSGSAL